MWIVRVALNRPYTFVVLALLILGIGPLTIARTPTDIFPSIDIPVVSVIWNYAGLSEQERFDLGVNCLRPQLATIQGAAIPWPYGGKQPQIQVDLDPAALQAKGLSPGDVVNAINQQNLILPGGTSKIGSIEYDVDLNASPTKIDELNDLPIKTVGTTAIY